jgi:hypothetical protein
MKLRPVLVALLLLGLANQASAQTTPVAPQMRRFKFDATGLAACASDSCKLLNAVAANANASLRTVKLKVDGLAKVTLQVNFVRVAGTNVTSTCTASLDGGKTYASLSSSAITAGASTVSPLVDTWTTSATGNIVFEYDTRSYDYLKCVLASASGTTDTLTAFAVGAVGM